MIDPIGKMSVPDIYKYKYHRMWKQFHIRKVTKMLIREHALERYWLERRLELLDILDDFAREEFCNEESTINKDDWRLTTLKKNYADVMEPYSLAQTIRSIYPPHLYGDVMRD